MNSGNDQEFGIGVEREKIEFARLVFKDAEVGDFFSEERRGLGRVVVGDADEKDQPRSISPTVSFSIVTAPWVTR